MGGSLLEEELLGILKKYPGYMDIVKTFVETGTYKGETSRLASKIFTTVHTIEIVPQLYQQAKIAGRGIENIHYHLGDSLQVLKELCRDPVPAVYFLDSHQSGPDTGNNGKWVPLLEEIDLILSTNSNTCIFILDDVRLFNGPWDWKGITPEGILKQFGDRAKYHFIENDRMVVYT